MSKSLQIEQLNQSLQNVLRNRQVDVLADQSDDQLNVLLIKLPGANVSYPGLTEAIKSQIAMCKVPNIAKVRVLGLLQGHKLPEWEQTFPLIPISEEQFVPAVEVEPQSKPMPQSAVPMVEVEVHPQSVPQATSQSVTQSSQRRGSTIWTIGASVGIAAAFAMGYGLGALNHGTFADSSEYQQKSLQKNCRN